MRKFGFFCGFLLWLMLSATLACIPAVPFWIIGYSLTGCFVWLLVGMPVGMIISFLVLAAIFGKNDDRGDDDKKPIPDPDPSSGKKKEQPNPSIPVNRIKDWMPSKN
ncbi:MAG: hypothetical protein M0R80_03070 [Proteobacteria bacterium]|jgi:hypothetical protein|nr:hypothetical protein [Pseudomonadota bacterium]